MIAELERVEKGLNFFRIENIVLEELIAIRTALRRQKETMGRRMPHLERDVLKSFEQLKLDKIDPNGDSHYKERTK